MFGLQTLSCLHDIPVVRSSTDKLQDVYAKAKDTSPLIRFPCNLAETVADKSLQIALTVVNPFVKQLNGPVRVIDDYAAQKIRQIETKYPVINTSTEDVVNTFNEKTEPVRNVLNSVKDTTTSTIQQGKETVSNVASGVADSIFSFFGLNASEYQRRNSGKLTGLIGYIFSIIGSLFNNIFQKVETSLLWVRMLTIFFLLKIKQINDVILTKIPHIPFLSTLSQRFLIIFSTLLDYVIQRIVPDDRTLVELKKSRQQARYNQQLQYNTNRQNVKSNTSITNHQNGTRANNSNKFSRTELDYSNLTDNDLTQSTYNIENDLYTTENDDIKQLHERFQPKDIEILYSRVPTDTLPKVDNQGPLDSDQQQVRGRVTGTELQRPDYEEDDDHDEDEE